MTLRELYRQGEEGLRRYGVQEADLDARLLLCEAFDRSTSEYLLDCDRELTELMEEAELSERLDCYERYLNLRAARRPMQQILGETQFMGLRFAVDENVLIPRQDTETLVEEVLQDVPQKDIRLLDMCTGSGCIAVSLFVLGGYEEVVAADLSREALYVAQKNGARLQQEMGALHESGQGSGLFGFRKTEPAYEPKLRFVQSDLFRDMGPAMEALGYDRFDVITINPPYIPTAVLETLAPEVRDFEPRMALDGSEDGLLFYRRIAKEAQPFLSEGGRLYLEIGADEAAAVTGLLQDAGFSDIQVVKDLPGKDRVVKARLYRDGAEAPKKQRTKRGKQDGKAAAREAAEEAAGG